MRHNKYLRLLLVTFLFPIIGQAAATKQELLEKTVRASQVLEEVLNISHDSIPLSLLDRAVCIAVLPDVLRGGFVFGARIGQGLVSCRVGNSWSQPSFVRVVGGNWGLQLGVASVDMVLVFINTNAVERLSENNFTLGGEISVAVGPIGRGAQAETDYQLKSEVYTYSRSRGLFGGLTIGGATFQVDHEANAVMYKNKSTPSMLLNASGNYAPRELRPFVSALEMIVP